MCTGTHGVIPTVRTGASERLDSWIACSSLIALIVCMSQAVFNGGSKVIDHVRLFKIRSDRKIQ